MMEIRSIAAPELEEFLWVLCEVFGLSLELAKPLFTSEPMFDLERKWALFDSGKIVSVLTTTPLEFGFGKAVGIAGVATVAERRGEGLAAKLLNKVVTESENAGETSALLFAHDPRLYTSLGFEPLDFVVRGLLSTAPVEVDLSPCPITECKVRYTEWSLAAPNRLLRDEQRWAYWDWGKRAAKKVTDGYLCHETGTVREVLVEKNLARFPVPLGTEWVGLGKLTEMLEIPLATRTDAMYYMGRNLPGYPELFMTDQF
jgi:predicted N-acetyltransferase YhbS